MQRVGLRLETGPPFALESRAQPGSEPPEARFEDLKAVAVLADGLGYESLWVPEGFGKDSITQLTALALATERIKLATGIITVFTRSPATIAMSAGSLDGLSGGRFLLGIGVGHPGMTRNGHGVAFERPITRVRETIEVVRLLLKGGPVDYDGKVLHLSGASIGFTPPRSGLPIYLAALKPGMVELAGEVADGVLLNFASREYIAKAVKLVRQGAAKAGRDPDSIDIACYLRVVVTDEVERLRPGLRRLLAGRLRLPYYARSFEEQGFADEAAAITEALGRGDDEAAAAAVSDRVLEAMIIAGSAEECRREIDELRSLGLKLPVLSPIAVGDPLASLSRTVEALAP